MTAVDATPLVDPATLVDLDRYPILDLDAPAGRAVVAAAHRQFAATGAAELPGFLHAEGLAACVADAVAIEPLAHRSSGGATPYLEPVPDGYEPGHPRVSPQPFSLGAVGWDLFPATSPVRALYEWPTLLAFVAGVLGQPELHRYADPLGGLNLATMVDGDTLGWHFDQTDFVVSLALRSADQGGLFDVVPGTRAADDERYDRVARILAGEEGHDVLPNRPGTLLVFAGRRSLHRVSPIAGPTSRLIALFGFDTKAGTCATPSLQRSRYGRVRQPGDGTPPGGSQ